MEELAHYMAQGAMLSEKAMEASASGTDPIYDIWAFPLVRGRRRLLLLLHLARATPAPLLGRHPSSLRSVFAGLRRAATVAQFGGANLYIPWVYRVPFLDLY